MLLTYGNITINMDNVDKMEKDVNDLVFTNRGKTVARLSFPGYDYVMAARKAILEQYKVLDLNTFNDQA